MSYRKPTNNLQVSIIIRASLPGDPERAKRYLQKLQRDFATHLVGQNVSMDFTVADIRVDQPQEENMSTKSTFEVQRNGGTEYKGEDKNAALHTYGVLVKEAMATTSNNLHIILYQDGSPLDQYANSCCTPLAQHVP